MKPRTLVPSYWWKLPALAVAAAGALLGSQVVRAELGDEALVKEAGAACKIASELEQSRVVWSSPDYETHAALILAGKPRQAQMSGAGDEIAYMLCLFDKQTAKVELQPIEAKLFR